MNSRILGAAPRSWPAPLTAIEVKVQALDMVVEWRRCGIVADYIADYLALSCEQSAYARSVISTVANELMENAVHFSAEKSRPIHVQASHRGDVVELAASNVAEARHIAGLERLFADLSRGDLVAVFRERVEAASRGGLGLLGVVKDYAAELGAVLASNETEGLVDVRVHVLLPAKELMNHE